MEPTKVRQRALAGWGPSVVLSLALGAACDTKPDPTIDDPTGSTTDGCDADCLAAAPVPWVHEVELQEGSALRRVLVDTRGDGALVAFDLGSEDEPGSGKTSSLLALTAEGDPEWTYELSDGLASSANAALDCAGLRCYLGGRYDGVQQLVGFWSSDTPSWTREDARSFSALAATPDGLWLLTETTEYTSESDIYLLVLEHRSASGFKQDREVISEDHGAGWHRPERVSSGDDGSIWALYATGDDYGTTLDGVRRSAGGEELGDFRVYDLGLLDFDACPDGGAVLLGLENDADSSGAEPPVTRLYRFAEDGTWDWRLDGLDRDGRRPERAACDADGRVVVVFGRPSEETDLPAIAEAIEEDGTPRWSIELGRVWVRSLDASTPGRLLAAGEHDGRLWVAGIPY